MSKDPDIRAALEGKFKGIDRDSGIPSDTLRKAKRRRRYAMAASTLGGLASVLLIVLGSQIIDSPQPNGGLAPASTPSAEGSSTSQKDENQDHATALEPGILEAPPSVTVKTSDQVFDLNAWSYCYKNGCADGAPLANPPDVGSPEEVMVEFPLPDWSFTASFTPAGEKCGRIQQVQLEDAGDGAFVLRPVGHADTYDVTLFGKGEGDLFVTFRWSTPSDGPLPKPKARAAIIAGEDGSPHSYGVELELMNLAETPNQASATITVRAANRHSITFEATGASERCWPEGTVYWDGPDDKGSEAAKLGQGPFEYIVQLTLDGERYVGTGTWPTDEIRGNEPSVSLDFSPNLPGLR
jgi:hypothetical protein